MRIIPHDIQTQYDIQLQKAVTQSKYHTYYQMWLRSYVFFCRKSGMPEIHQESLDRFMLTLAEQGKAPFQQKQAAHAVSIYFGIRGCAIVDESPAEIAADIVSGGGPSKETI